MQKYKAQIKMIFFGFFNIVILYVFYQQSQVSNWAIYIHSRLSPTIYILGMLIFFSVDIFIAYLLIKKNHLSSNMKWFYVIIGTILGSIITLGVLLLWSSIGEFGVYPY